MATRQYRLAEFSTVTPVTNAQVELLCEDKSGTYVLPFPCEWSGQEWRNANTSAAIDATVVGWRAY